MERKSKIFSGKHVKWTCQYHLVFVTKYRQPLIEEAIWDKMEPSFKQICKAFDGELKEANWEKDHVHLLISLPPKHSVSKLVNSLKGISSRYSKLGTVWSPSYYVGTCGDSNLDTIQHYIKEQRNSSSA